MSLLEIGNSYLQQPLALLLTASAPALDSKQELQEASSGGRN